MEQNGWWRSLLCWWMKYYQKSQLSDSLQRAIQGLKDEETKQIGAFKIVTGSGEDANEIDLQIYAPSESNQFSIENKIQTNKGIYEAFEGLCDLYGLFRVDRVAVELES